MPALSLESGQRALPLPTLPNFKLRVPRWSSGFALAVLVLGLAVSAMQWRDPDVTRLQFEGAFERVRPEAVRQAATSKLARGFFAVDIDAVRDQVALLPWVSQARVERVWPTGLRVRVWERQAYARWNAASLLDTSANAFTPAAADLPEALVAGLPRLGGTPGTEAKVSQTYRTLSKSLADTSVALSGLQIDARGEWTAQTQSGIELRFGQGDPAAKLPVLLEALPSALGERMHEVAYVDLRYTNGFAIGWVPQDPAAHSKDNKSRPAGVTGQPRPATPGSAAQEGGKRG